MFTPNLLPTCILPSDARTSATALDSMNCTQPKQTKIIVGYCTATHLDQAQLPRFDIHWEFRGLMKIIQIVQKLVVATSSTAIGLCVSKSAPTNGQQTFNRRITHTESAESL